MSEKDIIVRVGKNGMTPQLIGEVRTILAKYKTVKVKLLKTALDGGDRRSLAEDLKKKCKAKHAEMIGHVITLRE